MIEFKKNFFKKGTQLSQPEFAPEDSDAITFLREMVRNRPGGENRPQQEHAVLAIERALSCGEHLLIQAGTGTGKSFATLIPAILSGERIVYSTATKQLSEQLVNLDVPTLRKEAYRQGAKPFSAVLLKGRENYLCLRKHNELTGDVETSQTTKPKKEEQDGLFDEESVLVDTEENSLHVEAQPFVEADGKTKRERDRKPSAAQMKGEYEAMFAWARRTRTGDRSEAPAMSDEVWGGISVNNNDCVGKKSCPFGEECYSEVARADAKKAQVVVTNHAMTALDLEADENSLLGPRSVYIFDEVHEVDNFLSSAWGTVISEKILYEAVKVAKKFKPNPNAAARWDKTIEEVGLLITDLNSQMLKMEDGLIWPEPLGYGLEATLKELQNKLMEIVMVATGNNADEGQKEQIRRTVGSVSEAISTFLHNDEENVRWVKNEIMKKEDDFSKKFKQKGKKKEPAPPSLHCAPMRIGPRLMQSLADKSATMVGTSATITVGGQFTTPIHDFGLEEELVGATKRAYNALDVGTPFDYSKQAMFYVPDADEFPSAEYKFREEHSAAVESTTLNLVQAMGGRSLILTTTTRRINDIADHLEDHLPEDSGIRILRQGDMPAPQLIDEFVKDETSVLVATMGMWHGLNAEGPTCMLVVMDKIPFPTLDDPLATARQKYANNNGRNGFMDVYVASANIRIAQGFGRLIRTMSDRGIVAMLDTRITTKRYGQAMMKSLPPRLRTFHNEETVLGAANRLREAREKELADS